MEYFEVVAGIIKCNDEYLCLKRPVGRHSVTSLKYEFPGGKIEEGENQIQALKRELIEEVELDLDISQKNFFVTVNCTYCNLDITIHSYVCNVTDKRFVMKEHVDFKWLTKEHLLELDWAKADMLIVKKILER